VTLKIKMYKYLLVTFLFIVFASAAFAQTPDTTSSGIVKNGKDTITLTRQHTLNRKEYTHKIKRERVYHPDSIHNPHTAVIRSLILPGWGQAYNHQWWKVPVIYAVIGLLGDAIIFNNTYYKEFLALSKYREFAITPGPNDPYYAQAVEYKGLPPQAIYDATDGYRRDRDLSILGIAGFWGINAIDAYISAKFIHSYTLDEKLSMKVDPGVINQPNQLSVFAQNSVNSVIPGIKITFTF
jgi:Family of unknown function (DUF5683)